MYVYDPNVTDTFQKIFIIKKKEFKQVSISKQELIRPHLGSYLAMKRVLKFSLKKANFRIQKTLKIVFWEAVFGERNTLREVDMLPFPLQGKNFRLSVAPVYRGKTNKWKSQDEIFELSVVKHFNHLGCPTVEMNGLAKY